METRTARRRSARWRPAGAIVYEQWHNAVRVQYRPLASGWNMFIRRMRAMRLERKWAAVVLDLTVVVVGIVLAFQVDRWNESRKDRQLERVYLERLRADLETETQQFEEIVIRTGHRLGQIRLLDEAIGRPESVASRPEEFAFALEQVTWRSFPTITAYTYSELVSTGRMTLLRVPEFRSDLADYYTIIEETRRLGFGEDDHDRFRNATVGLLSAGHLSAIEDPDRYPMKISADQAVAIAKDLGARREARDWLPRLAKYQVLMRRRASQFIEMSERLIATSEPE